MKNILVTGGAGYIGSHTVKALKEAGYQPVVLDNLSSGHKDAIKGTELVIADLNDQKAISAAFQKYKPEAVVHFAGFIEAGESVTDPQRFFENNIVNGLNLLNTMVENKVKIMVFSSSAAIYGNPEKLPITEEDEKKPTNPYGLTKLMFEQILETYDIAYGLKSVSLRYFNAAGADTSGKIGPDHKHKTHLITLALLTALGKRDSIKVFGMDYDTPDGTCIRDYVHVLDLAKAHILALQYLDKNNKSNYFNLGNENGSSVKEVLEMTKQVSKRDFAVKYVGRREGDPAKVVASSSKAKLELGWEPEFGSLEEIIKTAYRWHKENPNGFSN